MTPDPAAAFSAELSRFASTSLDAHLAEQGKTNPQVAALRLVQYASAAVPAYQKFLAEHGVRADRLLSSDDLRRVPLTSKRNYMRAYSLPERCWQGTLRGVDRVAVSSGSTGEPTIWPRAARHELDVAFRFEQVFRDSFRAQERSTLCVVCFTLGNWVGGMYTASCCWLLAQKGYPLTVATPGNKREEIFRVLSELAPYYDQTVLLGYPPFIKDVIDAGTAAGMDWPRYRVKMVFAGEVFSEEWRQLILSRVGSKRPCYDTASLYGTADGGVLGNETPLSIAIRRFCADRPDAGRQLFGESRLPTLVQYDPVSRYFELQDGTLVVTGDNGVPLMRYHIADRGGLVSYAGMCEFLKEWGVVSLADYGLDLSQPVRALPFVYVFGRADFTVSYYGANIYPENISVGLEQPEVVRWVTGKFVLEAPETQTGDKVLRLTVELLPEVTPEEGMAERIAAAVARQLLRLNSEFANYTPPERQLPEVALCSFGDQEYFPAGVKHRYTRR